MHDHTEGSTGKIPSALEPKEGEPKFKHVDSTSDDRTANNAVRHQYKVLSDEEKQQMLDVKDLGAQFLLLCEDIEGGTPMLELAIARTKIEEAVMWAVKGVTG